MEVAIKNLKKNDKLEVIYNDQEYVGIVETIGKSQFARLKGVKTNQLLITVRIPTGYIVNIEEDGDSMVKLV